ncbi:hypothetical protein H0H93_006388, partial [Arthromyces matolae]
MDAVLRLLKDEEASCGFHDIITGSEAPIDPDEQDGTDHAVATESPPINALP